MSATVYIALGSNLGERRANLRAAIDRLGTVINDVRVSPLYDTEPAGYVDQPRFLNAVVSGSTDLAPLALLHAMQVIEHEMGRERPFPNAPRTIDLDLLFYEDLVLDTPDLTLPHPRLHERAFVLAPLADIAPEVVHPVLRRTVRELLAGILPADRQGTPTKL